MRKLIVAVAAVAWLGMASPVLAGGADRYDDSQSHPLRILAYIVHPVGYTLEWLATRPFHEFVAQPDLEPVFGHTSHTYYGDLPAGSIIAQRVTNDRRRDDPSYSARRYLE